MLHIPRKRFSQITKHKKQFGYFGLFKRITLVLIAGALVLPYFYTQPAEAVASHKVSLSGSSYGSVTINKPAEVIEGDIIIALVSMPSSAYSTPFGWTLVNNMSNGSISSYVFYRFVKASDTSYYFNATNPPISVILSFYSNVNQENPIAAKAVTSGTAATPVSPSVTTDSNNAVILGAYSNNYGGTYTAGSGMTLRAQNTSQQAHIAIQDAVQPVAGASGTKQITLSSGNNWIAHTVALRSSADFEQSGYRWFNNQDATASNEYIKKYTQTGSTTVYPQKIIATSDGGHMVVGHRYQSLFDQVITKYSSAGVVEWAKAVGGSAFARVVEVSGGYAVVFQSYDSGGRIVVMRLTSTGSILWQKYYGGSFSGHNDTYPLSIASTTGGDLVISGYASDNFSGENNVAYVVVNSSNGNLLSSGLSPYYSQDDRGVDVTATADGGFAILSYKRSYWNHHYTIIKHNSSGAVEWAYDETSASDGYKPTSLTQASDGGYVVVGDIYSGGVFVNKHSSSGSLSWSKKITEYNSAMSVVNSSDGGYVVGGGSVSPGLGISFVAKFTSAGVLSWAKENNSVYQVVSLARASDGDIMALSHKADDAEQIARYNSDGIVHGCDPAMCYPASVTVTSSTPTVGSIAVSYPTTGAGSKNSAFSLSDIVFTQTDIANGTAVDTGSPLNGVAQNSATQAPRSSSTIFRLRLLQHVINSSAYPGVGFKLQYAVRGADAICDASFTGETYADVTASTPIAFADNTTGTDGMALLSNVNDPTHSGHNVFYQEYNEANNTQTRSTIPMGHDGLWDFALKNNGAPYSTNYCFRMTKADGSLLAGYSQIPEIYTGPEPTLSVGFVDGSDNPLTNPTFDFTSSSVSTSSYQSTTGTLGTSAKKIRVFNSLATNGWNVTLSPTDGDTALWKKSDNSAFFDFNDSGVSATDSGIDADTYGGQLSVNPTGATISSSCSTSGTSRGTTNNFLQGAASSISLMSATSSAAMDCSWDLTGVSLTQTIPKAQPQGTYTISMTVTVVQL